MLGPGYLMKKKAQEIPLPASLQEGVNAILGGRRNLLNHQHAVQKKDVHIQIPTEQCFPL